MMRSRLFQGPGSLFLSLILLGFGPLHAQPSSSAFTAADPASGLRLDAEAMARLIGNPPAPGSLRDLNEQAILLWLQRIRTPEMVSAAWLPVEKSLGYFNRALGGDLKTRAPQIHRSVSQFLKPIENVKDVLKDRWNRKRPFQAIAQLSFCVPAEVNTSYPSGHTIWYASAGLLLADLFPERAERLVTTGRFVAYTRVTCGMHYPSDVLAGHAVAEASVRQILASPQWQQFKASPFVQEEKARIRSLSPQTGLPELYYN